MYKTDFIRRTIHLHIHVQHNVKFEPNAQSTERFHLWLSKAIHLKGQTVCGSKDSTPLNADSCKFRVGAHDQAVNSVAGCESICLIHDS